MSVNALAIDQVAKPGDNHPPADTLGARLKDQYSDLLIEMETWRGTASRAPKEITNDEQLAGVGRIIVKLRDIRLRAASAHEAEKKPYLTAGRTVDQFFNAGLVNLCNEDESRLGKVQTAYTRKKEAEARARAEAEERARREEAETKLAQARHAEDHGDTDTASKLLSEAAADETKANQAAHVANASTADLVRVASPSKGVTVSARAVWDFEIEQYDAIDLNQLKAQFARADVEKAIRAFVRLGGRELKGVKIYEDQRAVNRG